MEQSKSYNRPGGYSPYGAGTENVTVVDLLAQILDEVQYLNAPARRRDEVQAQAVDMNKVIDRDGGRCRRCRRMVDMSHRHGPQAPSFFHVDQEVGPPYVLLCRQCRVYASGSEESRREVVDAVGTTALTARFVGEQGPELRPFFRGGERPSTLKGRLEFEGGRAHITMASGDTFDVGPARQFPESSPTIGFFEVVDKLPSGDDSVPERSSDTPETPDVDDDVTHYSFVTPAGRPFLSRMLCDLAGFGTYPQVASSNWARVTCPQCQDIGADTVIALHCMSSDALVSLGAVATQDEATR